MYGICLMCKIRKVAAGAKLDRLPTAEKTRRAGLKVLRLAMYFPVPFLLSGALLLVIAIAPDVYKENWILVVVGAFLLECIATCFAVYFYRHLVR